MSYRLVELYGDTEKIRLMGENGKAVLEKHFNTGIMIDNFGKVFAGEVPDPYTFISDEQA